MLTGLGWRAIKKKAIAFSAMSEEQLSAFLAALKADAGLQEKLKGAADLDAAVAMAQEAGFDVTKGDWLKYQAKRSLDLNEEELEVVAGGFGCGSSCQNTAHTQAAGGCQPALTTDFSIRMCQPQ